MTGNLSILYRNIMDGLPSDLASDAFLWATERPGEDRMCCRAERFAREAHEIVATLRPLLDKAAEAHGLPACDPDLKAFILRRHANWCFGGNVSPSYAGGGQ